MTDTDQAAELRRDIRDVREARRRAEREAERIPALKAAIEATRRDLWARSGPALREVEERAEHIRARVAAARRTTDGLMFNVHRIVNYWAVEDAEREASGEVLTPIEHPELLPGVRKMQAAMDLVAEARRRTDAAVEGQLA